MLGQKQHKVSRVKGDMQLLGFCSKTNAHSQAKPSINYYPFGSSMVSYSSPEYHYSYGFGRHEKDDEVKGEGNWYSFGDYGYNPRIGRRPSPDPHKAKYPFISPYAYALNSPILYDDPDGQDPNVAIIIGPGPGESGHNDFNDHYAALKKQGYTVVYAETGKQALELMNKHSSPESPTENLILLSHGSPGGLSNGSGGGVYTNMEINTLAKWDWKWNNYAALDKEFLESQGIIADGNDPNYNQSAVDAAYQADSYDNFVDSKWNSVSGTEIDNYKTKTGAITPEDIKKEMANGNFATQNLTVVLGGCNTSGYVPLDAQDIFSTEMATETSSTVYGAQGYTAPVHSSAKRTSKTWIKTESNGNRTTLKKNTIDLTKPE